METLRSSLDLGSSYPVDTSSIESDYAKFYPITPLSDNYSPLVFVVESASNYYVQFSDSFLYLRLKIVDQAGKPLTSTVLAAGSFDLMSSIFSGIEIDQNGTLVSTSATLYPYRSHLVKLLSYDSGYKQSIAQQELWFPDTKQDDFSAENSGFAARADVAKLSSPFEIVGKLSESIFEQNRYFPPGITTKVTLRRSLPEFCLETNSATTKLSYEILNAILYVRRHCVSDSVVAYHHKLLNSNHKLQFPLNHFVVRAFNIKENTTSVLSEPIFRGKIPSYLLVSFVLTEALQGSLSRQCFNLQHFNISQISAKIDGESRLYEAINFDFDNNQTLIGYNSLNSALLPGADHGITIEQYKKGNFVVCLGINPNDTVNGLVLERQGTTQLDIKFAKALEKPITCVIVGRFQGKIEVDKNYNVSVE